MVHCHSHQVLCRLVWVWYIMLVHRLRSLTTCIMYRDLSVPWQKPVKNHLLLSCVSLSLLWQKPIKNLLSLSCPPLLPCNNRLPRIFSRCPFHLYFHAMLKGCQESSLGFVFISVYTNLSRCCHRFQLISSHNVAKNDDHRFVMFVTCCLCVLAF